MKILYDYQIFAAQRYGGISRYYYELFLEFEKSGNCVPRMPYMFSNNYYINNRQNIKHSDFFRDINFRGKTRILNIFNKALAIKELKKQDFDVFHPTYYDPYFLNYIGKKPFVITVHDMIHEKFFKMFTKKDKTSLYKKYLVEKAKKIIAVSENTKKDLIDFFNIDEHKIEVIYHGNSMLPPAQQIEKIYPKKFIFYVGGRSTYKNFNNLIKAISSILIAKDFDLVCAGGGTFNKEELLLINELGVSQKIVQLNLSDEQLSLFYNQAEFFVFPSMYEGFGIPILEAFSCRSALVCSNTSSLPEIAGDGAVYFDPNNLESIRNAANVLLENNDIKKNIVEKGVDRLKFFSWEKTASSTLDVYNAALTL